MADHAAPSNLMGYLFAKDVMTQSMRLGLAGAWDESDPALMEALALVDNRCPTLVQSFLPTHERTQEDDDESRAHHIHGDIGHTFAQLSLKGFVLGNQLRIKPRANLMKLAPRHPFLQQLMLAYSREYGMNVIDFGHKPLKWYRRLAYTDS